MPVNFMPAGADYLRILPEIIMTVAGTLIMLIEGLLGENKKRNLSLLTFLAFAAALVAAVVANGSPGPSFSNMLIVDGFATFFRVLVIAVGILGLFSAVQYLKREHAESSEYYALLLFSVTGQCIMATANELIMIFIGLEISSIATYILAGYLRDDKRNNEAALKYFLLGSFATAFLLYGIAWIYGTTGSTNLAVIRTALLEGGSDRSMILAGTAAALMFVGFAFKVSAAPFQIWAPDVYQGAPAPVTLFMSVGPKAAAFAVFLRVFMTAFGPITNRWEPFVWSSALLSMIIGNFAALYANQHQANAGLQLHRARGLHHGGHRRTQSDRRCGRHVLPGRLCPDEHRRVRRDHAFLAARRKVREHRRPGRARLEAAGDRRAILHLPALAGGRSAHRGILREVLHLSRCHRCEPGLAGRARHAQQRGGSLLLSARPGCDVYE